MPWNELLGDAPQAGRYRKAAEKLKHRFNLNTTEGGFWDAEHKWYVHWRDKDGSVHGNNLVLPVNFSAIGYGLCDEPARRAAILDRVETLMQQEELFFWPLCFFSYEKLEVHPKVNWPFPRYENGDLFLAWGELGTRSYASQNPARALKYVKNVLTQYSKDGLAFQRYHRRSQTGDGKDILANNSSTVVGLYRNLYGVQPKHNRLYLEPHLTPELNGTLLKYWLRGKEYRIALSMDDYAIAAGNFTVHGREPFAVNADDRSLEYFPGSSQSNALAITTSIVEPLELTVRFWPGAFDAEQRAPVLRGSSATIRKKQRTWIESCRKPGVIAQHVISGLAPNEPYQLLRNGARRDLLRSDASGRLTFDYRFAESGPQNFELAPRR